ncbi:MAG: MATE family efflux transporter [Clostridiales Family XIII bacterium]|jgi:putative MATE family efflux protein|nr:MATE family efflux transporter [Clostridiales Family XIII bacterium]
MDPKENKMGTLPIGKLILNMSLPPMISMLVAALYNVIDSIFVAKISEDALAAVTLVFPVQMLMMSITVGIGVGNASLISRRLGQKRQMDADSAAAHGILLGLICWVLYALFGLFLAGPFLSLYVDPVQNAGIYSMALDYCRIVMMGSAFINITVAIERILQSTGNTLYPMVFNGVAASVNAVLATIFITGEYGMPALGVRGAGYIAVFGQMIGCVLALLLFRRGAKRGMNAVSISFKGFRARGKTLRDILAVGAPSIVMMAVQPLLISGLNGILIAYSTTAVAVLGVYFRIQTFVIMPVIGLNQGALPIMGYNFGARNRVRLTATFKLAFKVAIVIMIVGTAVFWIFPHAIMGLFNPTPEMLDMGVHALRAISISWIPASFVIICIGLFQALAHGVFALVISVVRQLGLILPLAYFLALYYGVNAAWYSYAIAEISAFTLSLIFLARVRRQEIAKLPDGAPVK